MIIFTGTLYHENNIEYFFPELLRISEKKYKVIDYFYQPIASNQ